MVDFRKRLKHKKLVKRINPIEIYESLDRRSETGPLRPSQKEILENWFSNYKNKKDLIIKLHTGQGKTLIGHLILQSKINQNEGPALYLCPNIHLAKQTCQQAEKFGIKYTEIDENNCLPDEFLNGKAMLITHIQKLFNGKTIFGIDGYYKKINTIVLDDSHACIDSIRNSFSIHIRRQEELYDKILQLFEDDLISQGEGTLIEIKNGEYNSFLPVPYWAWHDKKAEILNIVSQHREENNVKFVWPLIKNEIENCQGFISGHEIEIIPYFNPIHKFGSFDKAKNRILMSATTQNDSFFIKGLCLDKSAVLKPLIYSNENWSGEKMIIIPSLINENLQRDKIAAYISKTRPKNKSFGIGILTPSFKTAKLFEVNGALLANRENIIEYINLLKTNNFTNSIVFANRYDGIDLPDNSCRMLVLDSMPYAENLSERYEEDCREDSDIIKIKLTQKIEQGLGRSVRGEKDYSVIIITGNDLIKFIKSTQTNSFFSPQTKKQIEIGLEIAEISREDMDIDEEDDLRIIIDLIKQSIRRDEAWKEFYIEKMSKIKNTKRQSGVDVTSIFEQEKQAEEFFYLEEPERAVECVQKLIDEIEMTKTEKGWYLQIMARYQYTISKTESNNLQKNAFRQNYQLLKPKEGVTYKKLDFINENRIQRLKKWISKEKNYNDLMLKVEDFLCRLAFGQMSGNFENSMKELGLALGFLSQRPCKEIKKGPDNLWGGVNNKFIFFECKSEVKDTRTEINKSEASQMNTHCAWFEDIYGKEVDVTRVLIIPTKKLSSHANLGYDVKVIRKSNLRKLRENVKSFFKEFKNYNITEISDGTINNWLNQHKLDINSITTIYLEDVYIKNKYPY